MFEWKEKAQNAILLDENTGGKGKLFRSRFLQAGLVKYSFGVCVLENDTIHKFIQGFVGCPVIIDHKDVTNENAKEERVGVISRVWFDEMDGWFWGEGVIFDEHALSLIEEGYNVSCQYEITEYANNTDKRLHNGNPYDKVILNGKPEHLAIVKNPRYENALIAINALDLTEETSEDKSKTVLEDVLQAINEIKETDMFSKLFKKKENKMDKDELKSLFMECLSELTAKNEADEDKKEEKKEDEKLADDKVAENEDEKDAKKGDDKDGDKDAENKCKNEVVDKRDIIRQIMAIAGKEEASEDVKTIAKLAEKLAYDKSEADKKADNKCKNEEEDEKDDKKEDEKEKASNSIDELIGKMSFGSERAERTTFMTQKKAVELGDKLF